MSAENMCFSVQHEECQPQRSDQTRCSPSLESKAIGRLGPWDLGPCSFCVATALPNITPTKIGATVQVSTASSTCHPQPETLLPWAAQGAALRGSSFFVGPVGVPLCFTRPQQYQTISHLCAHPEGLGTPRKPTVAVP